LAPEASWFPWQRGAPLDAKFKIAFRLLIKSAFTKAAKKTKPALQ
jgi:hypothetical protein